MELLLEQRELLDLGHNRQGLIIICRAGTCWLTQSGDARDYLLRCGQKHEVRGNGQLILSAIGPCRVRLATQKPLRRALIPATVGRQ